MPVRITFASLMAFVLLASPAAALDGEILINQAKVYAGGITPGDAPGFPATLSRSGRYKLTGNLAVPAGVVFGIGVTQDDVTIDLNGFTISSSPPRQVSVGVRAVSVSGMRVTNGTVSGFGEFAIQSFGNSTAFAVVENMRIINNKSGVRVEHDLRVLNSTIADNDGDGVHCFGCTIERSVITGNGIDGIHMAGAGTVVGNAIVSNGNTGLINASIGRPGLGDNIFLDNGMDFDGAVELHSNYCEPACP